MMRPWSADGIDLGEGFESENHFALFGSAALAKSHLASRFPDYRFAFLQQVHGPTVVAGNPLTAGDADGHLTGDKNVALVIQTADCVPILMANKNQICALHAGWRGAAAKIVETAAGLLRAPPDWVAFGPHIQFGSFEVGREVADQLAKAAPEAESAAAWIQAHVDPQKCFFNLAGLLRAQVHACFPDARIWCSSVNTISDSRYHSYRRDKPDQGRQYSFVVLK